MRYYEEASRRLLAQAEAELEAVSLEIAQGEGTIPPELVLRLERARSHFDVARANYAVARMLCADTVAAKGS